MATTPTKPAAKKSSAAKPKAAKVAKATGNSTRAPEKMPTKSRQNEVRNRGLAPGQRARAAHLRAHGARATEPSELAPSDDWLSRVFADDAPSEDSLFTDGDNGLTHTHVTASGQDDDDDDAGDDNERGDVDFPPLPDDGLGPLGSGEPRAPRVRRSITDLIGDLTPEQYAEAKAREPYETQRWSGAATGATRPTQLWMPLDQLVLADYNPRAIDPDEFSALKSSIDEFGMPDPIIVNQFPGRENVVVGGHQRAKAARDLGWREVPVTWVYLNPVRERQLNVALNRISGRWEERMLAEVLRDLDDVGADLSMTGFSDEEVSEMLATTESIDDALNFGHEFDSEHIRQVVEVTVRCPPDEWSEEIADALRAVVTQLQPAHPHLTLLIKGDSQS